MATAAVGGELKKAFPEEPMPFAACGLERHKDGRGFNYVVRFPDKLVFTDDPKPKATVWFNVNKENYEGEAKEASWAYFKEVQTGSPGRRASAD